MARTLALVEAECTRAGILWDATRSGAGFTAMGPPGVLASVRSGPPAMASTTTTSNGASAAAHVPGADAGPFGARDWLGRFRSRELEADFRLFFAQEMMRYQWHIGTIHVRRLVHDVCYRVHRVCMSDCLHQRARPRTSLLCCGTRLYTCLIVSRGQLLVTCCAFHHHTLCTVFVSFCLNISACAPPSAFVAGIVPVLTGVCVTRSLACVAAVGGSLAFLEL
jgi:hypothetical protein